MSKILLSAGITVLFMAVLARADAVSSSTVTLEELLESAQKNNPEIRAAEKRWRAAQEEVSSVKTLEKPQVSYERMYSGSEKLFGISQEFPFPGKLRIKGEAASQSAVMAEEDLRAKEREIRSDVKTAFAGYFLAVKAIEIYEENLELMRRFSKVAESKYAVGKVSQTDVLRAQIELSKILNELVTLNQEKETAQAMLNTLLDRSPQEPLGVPQENKLKKINLSLEDLQNEALVNRPEILGSKAELDRSEKNLISRKLDFLPDIMAQYRARRADNPELDNTNDVMVGLTLPLWFWKQNAQVRMAQADREMREAEYRAMKNRTLYGVKDLLVKVQTAGRLMDLYETSVIPQAEQALKISESFYQSDKSSFLELVDVQRNLLQFSIDHYMHHADYERWTAELERLVGKDLTEVR